MTRRRVLAAVSIVLASSAVARAGDAVTLDGKRKTHVSYTGVLTDVALKADAEHGLRTDMLTPTLDDCTSTSCDITSLRLTLPKGSTSGRLAVTVTLERSLNAWVVLYDAKGHLLRSSDLVSRAQDDAWRMHQVQACCASSYVLDLTDPRLGAGKYQLVVYDRGGLGSFTTNVDFHAHPPIRKAPAK